MEEKSGTDVRHERKVEKKNSKIDDVVCRHDDHTMRPF
jgi:hypothetical protein